MLKLIVTFFVFSAAFNNILFIDALETELI